MSVWTLIILVVVNVVIANLLAGYFYRRRVERRERYILRHFRIEYPGSVIVMSAVGTSDLDALYEIKERLDDPTWLTCSTEG